MSLPEGWPSLPAVQSANWDYLRTASVEWPKIADQWASAFTEIHEASKRPGGTDWEGPAADAVQARTDRDVFTVRSLADQLREAGPAAGRGFEQPTTIQRLILSAVDDAQRDGFTVAPDYTVTDTETSYDSASERDDRAKAGQVHEDVIKYHVSHLVGGEHDIGQAITKATEGLDGLSFPDGGAGATNGQGTALGEPPDDPKQFTEWWNSLSPQQKDQVYSQDHNIGNHPGMPCDPPDHRGYDHYNQLNLQDQLGSARVAAAQADALRHQHPDWAAGKNIPTPNEPGAIFDDRQAYEAWQRQYDAAQTGAKYLPDLQAVDKAVTASPDRKLMLLDTQTGKQVRAAIAVGNPDTATHVSVSAAGLNTTVHGAIENMTEEAANVRKEALGQLRLAPGHKYDTVAAIAWIGYDPPQVPGFDDLGQADEELPARS